MSVREIESAITQLPPSEVKALAKWFADYQFKLWDEQIEDDLDAGRLDAILAQADKEYNAGLSKPL